VGRQATSLKQFLEKWFKPETREERRERKESTPYTNGTLRGKGE